MTVVEVPAPFNRVDGIDTQLRQVDLTPAPVEQLGSFPTRRDLRNAELHGRGKHQAVKRIRMPHLRWAVGRVRTSGKASARPRRNNRGVVLMAMLFAPALFATLGLPAYSYAPAKSVAPTSVLAAGAQSLSVFGAESGQISRDGFTATTVQQLQNVRRSAERAARIAAYNRSGAHARGDDYPWPVESIGVLSPLGYYYRECVDFVAWRLNRDAGSVAPPYKFVWQNLTPLGGDASDWARNWVRNGWQTSTTPIAGAVAWWPSNHVAYVKSVNTDGTVTFEDYNYLGLHRYDIRTVSATSATLYLYPPT